MGNFYSSRMEEDRVAIFLYGSRDSTDLGKRALIRVELRTPVHTNYILVHKRNQEGERERML